MLSSLVQLISTDFMFLGPSSFKDLDDEKIKQLVKMNPDTGKPFCALCKKEFARKDKAFEHIKNMHIGRKDVVCHYCTEAFTTLTLRNLHIYKHHNEQHQLKKLLNSWLVNELFLICCSVEFSFLWSLYFGFNVLLG